MILRANTYPNGSFLVVRRLPANMPKALSGNEAFLQKYDLLHFSNELIEKTRSLSNSALNEIIEAAGPESSSKQLEAVFKYGYDIFVAVSHLKRTIMLSNPLGKQAVPRSSEESLNLYSAFKSYFASAQDSVAA